MDQWEHWSFLFYTAMKIINLGIFAHIDAGKTTLTEQILHLAGAIRSVGSIEDGTTESDSLDIEAERGISILSSLLQFELQTNDSKIKINLLDTPGHLDFRNQVESVLDSIDVAIVVLDGSRGVESQTVLIHKELQDKKIPEIFFINKLDRNPENLSEAIISIEDILGKSPCVLFHEDENYVIWQNPEKFSDREHLDLFEWNDELSTEYLEHPSKIYDISQRGLFQGIVTQKLTPVLGGSAYFGKGVTEIMNLISQLDFPIPIALDGNELIVSKRMIHSELGKLTFARALKPFRKNSLAHIKNKSIPINQIYNLFGDKAKEVLSVEVGDMFASPDLNILEPARPIIDSPFAVIVEQDLSEDRNELWESMSSIVWEDPSYRMDLDPESGSFCLWGQGELHLEIFRDRLLKKFHKKFTYGELKVARYERSKIMEKQIVFEHTAFGNKHSSGKISATLRDTAGFSKLIAFEVSLPEKIQNVVTTGFHEALSRGNYHLEVLGLECLVHSFEPPEADSDQSIILLKIAVVSGIRSALSEKTDIIGPISDLEILVDDIHLGSTLSLLQKRNAQIIEILKKNSSNSMVLARAGTENLLGFSGALRNMTKGTGISYQRNSFNPEKYNVLNERQAR